MKASDYLKSLPSYIYQIVWVGFIGIGLVVINVVDGLNVEIPEDQIALIMVVCFFLANFYIFSKQDYLLQAREVEADKHLFEEFSQALSFFPGIDFLKEQDFGDSVETERLQPFFNFERTWRDASHVFLNSQLEKQRGNLYSAVVRFLEFGAVYTVPQKKVNGFVELNAIPEKFNEASKEWNRLAADVVTQHQKLTVLGKTILGI
jgi:hypothetical protein